MVNRISMYRESVAHIFFNDQRTDKLNKLMMWYFKDMETFSRVSPWFLPISSKQNGYFYVSWRQLKRKEIRLFLNGAIT